MILEINDLTRASCAAWCGLTHAVLTPVLQIGTFAWAAPEILLGQQCSERVDIWSCAPAPCWRCLATQACCFMHAEPSSMLSLIQIACQQHLTAGRRGTDSRCACCSFGVILHELSTGQAPTGRQLRPVRCANCCSQRSLSVTQLSCGLSCV